MAATRIEKDSMGQIEVPADQLWGAQTQRFNQKRRRRCQYGSRVIT